MGIKWRSGVLQYAIIIVPLLVSLILLHTYFFSYAISGPDIIKYSYLIILLIVTSYFMTLMILFNRINRSFLINSIILRFKENRITLKEVYDNIRTFLKRKNIQFNVYSTTKRGVCFFKPLMVINLPSFQTKIYILKDSLHINGKDADKKEDVKKIIEEFIDELDKERNRDLA